MNAVALKNFSAALNGAGQGDFVGILEVTADRQPEGEPCCCDAEWLQQPGDVESGGLPLNSGVCGHNDLGNTAFGDAGDKLPHFELIGADAVNGGNQPVEDMIESRELAGPLNGWNVSGPFDDTDDRGVSAGVGADGT
ncbi:hypothetical protein SDC9_65195 [bioreactor metagenome]|uniref:Uncharacterized protein n=1 Tax=bioreactor metagenome TaxID=1076179 RepID=A0A644XRS1_9ZZZZ